MYIYEESCVRFCFGVTKKKKMGPISYDQQSSTQLWSTSRKHRRIVGIVCGERGISQPL